MKSNRKKYTLYGRSTAHNAEFLDELDLVEQRIRDLKKQHNPKVEPQAKQSKTEALKDYIDNARFQVDYAYQAGGKEVALNLIAQMIKETKDTYQAKFLYRLKKEVQGLGESTPMQLRQGESASLPSKQSKIHKDLLESRESMPKTQDKEAKKKDPEKLAPIKEKTIRKVDNYAKLKAFKELSKDKQKAILYLKEIKPAPMPEGVSRDKLDNLMQHFSGKLDEKQRKIYSKLIDDTKDNADIKLDTQRDEQMRKAYIKAYQYKDTHDLYYMYVTQDNDKISVTSFPMTKLKDVISQIRNCIRAIS